MKLIHTNEQNSVDGTRKIIEQYHELKPFTEIVANGKRLVWFLPNETAWWRARNLLTVEVETIAWLDAFEAEDVLLDVGANMGLYSLYAGKSGHRVYAFEPESNNYSMINTNVYANQLSGKITVWCVALSDTDGLDHLYLSRFSEAGSGHSFGDNVDDNLNSRASDYIQGAVGMRLDTIVDQGVIPIPNHIKMDVDGFEHRVVNGGLKTLANPNLKSVMIEMNRRLPEHQELFNIMEKCGYHCSKSFIRLAEYQGGHFDQVGNILFARSMEWAEEVAQTGWDQFNSDPVSQQIKRAFETGEKLTGAFPDETLHLQIPQPKELLIVDSVDENSGDLLLKGRAEHPEFVDQLCKRLAADDSFHRKINRPTVLSDSEKDSPYAYKFEIQCR